jgi:hypothetical protein
MFEFGLGYGGKLEYFISHMELNYIVHFLELVEQKHRYEDPKIKRSFCFTILFMFCILYVQIYLLEIHMFAYVLFLHYDLVW